VAKERERSVLGQGLVPSGLHLQPGHNQLGVIGIGLHTLELLQELVEHMGLQLALGLVKKGTKGLEDGEGCKALVGCGHLDQLLQEFISVLLDNE